MYSFLSKYGQLIALCLGAFITIVMFVIIMASGSKFTEIADLGRIEYNEALSATSIFNFGLAGTLFLIVITALAVLVFGVLGIVNNFNNSKKGLIGFVGLLLVFVIGYFVANSMGDSEGVLAVIEKMNKKGAGITPSTSTFVSASLITTLFLGGASFIGLIAAEVWNLFR